MIISYFIRYIIGYIIGVHIPAYEVQIAAIDSKILT